MWGAITHTKKRFYIADAPFWAEHKFKAAQQLRQFFEFFLGLLADENFTSLIEFEGKVGSFYQPQAESNFGVGSSSSSSGDFCFLAMVF